MLKIYSLSRFQVYNTVSLPIISRLYTKSSEVTTGSSYALLSPISLPPSPWLCHSTLFLWVQLFFFRFHIWNMILYSVFFCFTSISVIPFRFIHVANGRISFALWPSTIPLCIYHIFCTHVFICQRMLRSFPYLGSREWCCSERGYTGISSR